MKKLVTERDVIEAWQKGATQIFVAPNGLVTPAAQDAAKAHNITIARKVSDPSAVAETVVLPKNSTTGKIVLGSDHAGFELKEHLKSFMAEVGYEVEDVGTFSQDSVDYPDIALAVAQKVAQNHRCRGVIIDGAGVGSAMAANKVSGVRAATCHDVYTARNSRMHNDANVLTLGSRVLGIDVAKDILRVWLQTDFGGGRHKRRVDKIMAIEKTYH
ncbi:MAG: ribose 5-phosphate isomerase B [bacterium]